MKRLITLALVLFILPVQAETIAELRARLVVADIVTGTSDPVPIGVAQTFTLGEDTVTVNEFSLPVLITTNDTSPPALRRSTILITVYDYNDPGESAHVTETRVHNYRPALSPKELLAKGKTALDAMIALSVPVPSEPGVAPAPIDYLDMRCTHASWVGRTIAKYSRAKYTSVDDTGGIYLYVYLHDGNGGTDREQAWIWVDEAGTFVVDPWEN
jgi:hypothetical protein